MKTSKISIDTKEALNRLAHPTFFSHAERMDAFEIVMNDGSSIQKASAEKAVSLWPIEGMKSKAVA